MSIHFTSHTKLLRKAVVFKSALIRKTNKNVKYLSFLPRCIKIQLKNSSFEYYVDLIIDPTLFTEDDIFFTDMCYGDAKSSRSLSLETQRTPRSIRRGQCRQTESKWGEYREVDGFKNEVSAR